MPKEPCNNWLEITSQLCASKVMNQPGENPPPYEPTPAELEMVLDETNIELKGRPLARSPEQGIADMKARIELLSAQILKSEGQTPSLERLAHDLREAKQRLGEYQAQLEGRN